MEKAQYAIMRFAKYKGPEIGNIEAHNERTKEKYASNPDVDTSRSKYNFHLVKPPGKYRAESERQIAAAGCRTRKDSIRMIETLFTASPEFFKGKKRAEIRVFFEEALHFLEQHQSKETIISAVVHMDEKTPHMHLCFVPLTEDGRLSAKDIMGNKKKLTWWQDEFWKHMVKKFPDLERGESASVFSTRPRVSVYGTGAAWISLADFLGSMVTSILPRTSTRYTVRFDSPRGFAYGNQYLHPSTGYSVSRQDCHFSVSTSLHEAVWEY